MTYTIEQLESTFAELEANKGHLIGVDIMAALTEDSHVLEVMSQLLDTIRALEDAQARIEAAAAIGEDVAAQDFPLYYAYSDGANSMRELFRAALGIE